MKEELPFNIRVYKAAKNSPEEAAALLDNAAQEILRGNRGEYNPELDINTDLTEQIFKSHARGLRFGPDGWIHDAIAAVNPWNYDPNEASESVETLIWSAGQDTHKGSLHTEWLEANIPGAQHYVQPRAQHITAVKIMPSVIDWLLTGKFSFT